MKKSKSDARGFTLFELLLLIAMVAVISLTLLPANINSKSKAKLIVCKHGLKSIGMVFLLWSNDNNDKLPTEVSVTNGGAMEAASVGDAVTVFEVVSNELYTPKLLFCPAEKSSRMQATIFGRSTPSNNSSGDIPFASNSNVSYFVGMDASTNHPTAFLIGDDNLFIGNSPAKSGAQSLTTNSLVLWSSTRHEDRGNIGLVDGSVQSFDNNNLAAAIKQTNLATNRLVMP